MDFTLSINQIAKLVAANGADKTYLIEGPMGSGKSSMIKLIEAKHGDRYNYITIDCTQWDVGDVQLPDADKEAEVMRFLPNVLLIGDGKKPMCIYLDEIGKASRPVQNAFLPVMLERRVGARRLPAGSIVAGTTNLGAEGVGDVLQPHARNRVSFIEMRHPTNDEWIQWGLENDVPPAVLAWADANPQVFQSFKDVSSPADNPYIFHPKEQRKSFVTARSLYLASIELREENRVSVNDIQATMAAIAGNIGARAALDLMAFITLADKLPRYSDIVANPMTARLEEDSAGSMMMSVYSCIGRIKYEDIDAVMTYIQRMPREIQAVFASSVLKVDSKKLMMVRNREFSEWARVNSWLLNG